MSKKHNLGLGNRGIIYHLEDNEKPIDGKAGTEIVK
jgi:hypothetical protein